MLLEEANQLLNPGYLPLETGYCRLPSGQMHIAVLTTMYKCRSDWLAWYFGNDINGIKSIKELEFATAPVNQRDKIWKIEPPTHNTTRDGEYLLGGTLHKFIIRYIDPARYFNMSKLMASKIGAVVCAETFHSDGTPDGCLIHIARDTIDGCEMRTRFWAFDTTEEIAKLQVERFVSTYNRLPNTLRLLLGSTSVIGSQDNIVCKYCNSPYVVRNGTRKDVQYWLCKKCHRSFINNYALPKMQYPAQTIAKAVSEYFAGNSLNRIRKEIEVTERILPSLSTVYRWIIKLTETARTIMNTCHPNISDKWIIDDKEISLNGKLYSFINIMDIETRFLLATRLFVGDRDANMRVLLIAAIKKAGKTPCEIIMNYPFNKGNVLTYNDKVMPVRSTFTDEHEPLEKLLASWYSISLDRLKPESGLEINSGTETMLEGFAIHYNYFKLHEELGDIPAKAAGIKFSLRSWFDVARYASSDDSFI